MAGRPRWQAFGKREPEQELEAREWIETITGEKFPEGVSYEDALQDGVLLCKLMNKLAPGSVNKINPGGTGHFKMVENLNKFQQAAKAYGVPEMDVFQSNDLSESYKHPEWPGPYLGPKTSERNERHFTEEQLRAGETVIGLQAGTNRGANQSGLSIGATRKILLGK